MPFGSVRLLGLAARADPCSSAVFRWCLPRWLPAWLPFAALCGTIHHPACSRCQDPDLFLCCLLRPCGG